MMLQSDKILILVGCTVSTLLFAVTTTGEEWIKRKPLQTAQLERPAKNDSQTVVNTERYFIFNSTNINYENTNSSYNINHINKIINNNNNNKQNKKRSMKRNGNEPFTVDYYGIWRFCFKNGQCLELVEAWKYTKWMSCPNWLQAVRIFTCTATGLEAFALLNTIAAILKNTKAIKESKYIMVASPCLMLIAMAIYTAFEKPVHQNYKWGWTFILGWASVGFSLVYSTTVLFMIARWKQKRKEDETIPIETPMMYELE